MPGKEIESITSLIPEFFYDLIGRVIPGCLFVIGFAYLLNTTTIKEFLKPDFTFFILLLGAGYAVGLILSFMGELLCRIFKTSQFIGFLKEFDLYDYIKKLVALSEDLSKKKVDELKRKDCEILFQIQHNHVKKRYKEQARSLSKSQAEVQLCINISIACIILFIILFVSTIILIVEEKYSKILYVPLIIFYLIAILSFCAAIYRNERFLMRQFSFSAEIKKNEENAEKTKSIDEEIILKGNFCLTKEEKRD